MGIFTRRVCTLFPLILMCVIALAQDDQRKYSGNYTEQTLIEIASDMEDRYSIRFYYDDDELPETEITASFDNVSLEEAMDAILGESLIGHITYRDYAVLLAPRYKIEQDLGIDYYRALETSIAINEVEPVESVVVIGDIANLNSTGRAKLTGTLTDAETQEPIIGANVSVTELELGAVSDIDGAYELDLPVGEYTLVVRYIGFATTIRNFKILSDGEIDLQIEKSAVELEEVTISADAADASVDQGQISVATLDVKDIKQLPSFFGEADVVKTLLLLPGVSTIGEGATGFNVRGGEVDQNLILQDEGMFMNSSHALGFYSAFNADLIGRVDLYKGNIPAEFGGRLASVMDIEMRDGDFSQWSLKGGIGPAASRLAVEGPIVKDKVSFIAGGRVSHANWILERMKPATVQNSRASFYDVNGRLTARLGEKNTLILSGYASGDEFDFNREFGFEYNTYMAQATFKSIFSDKLYNSLSATASEYNSTQFDYQGTDASQLFGDVRYIKVKDKLTYQASRALRVDAGIESIWYQTQPGIRDPLNDISTIIPSELEEEQANEFAVFAGAEWEVSPAFQVNAGLRFVNYRFTGPKTVFEYQNPDRPEVPEIIDSSLVDGKIASYNSIEPRISLRYKLSTSASIKVGYSRTAQFINQIFNADTPTPTSQWQLSTSYIEPTRSHNLSAGFFKNFGDNNWETSVEVYGRQIDALYDYKNFADLIVNPHIETELLDGIGRTYGAELSVKKKAGELNGFINYTLSRAERQIEGINDGAWFASNFDKTHVLSAVLNWQPNRRNTLTVSFNYSTGRPTSPPVGTYATREGIVVPVYTERNALRIPDYHRMDIAYTIGKGYKKDKKFQTSWTFSVYNLYGRKNAFSVFYTQAAFGRVQANQLSILGSAFPAITLNFEFR